MTSVMIDMFCGAGGESTGMLQACGDMGMNTKLYAINHWETAIATHSANHPDAEHFNADVEVLKPSALKVKKVALLWASPECTNHSRAKGGRPKDDQSRSTAWAVLKWLQELYVERVIVENVPEFTEWGPLGADNKPVKSQKGTVFKAWLTSLRALGYTVDWRILNAADYGDPTTRKRLFIQGVRGAKKIVWPEPTHAVEATDGIGVWRAAAECIDWTIPGQSIFDRNKPLCSNTIARIRHGLQKFGGKDAEPFMVLLNGGGAMRFARGLAAPAPTVTGSNHIGLVQPFLLKHYGQSKSGSLQQPMPTVTAGPGHISLVAPMVLPQHRGRPGNTKRVLSTNTPVPTITTTGSHAMAIPYVVSLGHTSSKTRCRSVDAPVPTLVTKNEHCLCTPFMVAYYGTGTSASVDKPMPTIVTKDRFGLVQAGYYDILFRMFQPKELAAAQGFPDDYIFCGNKTEVVKQIGNAVPVNLARALCRAALSNTRNRP